MTYGLLLLLVLADDFDRFEGAALASVPKNADAKAYGKLTISEIGNLPRIFASVRSPVLVATTDQGNLARLIVSPALRKPTDSKSEPVPVLVLERVDTLEAGGAMTRVARGRDVILFDGFRYDLDSAQVVPDGQGGDLRFLATGEAGPRLVAIDSAKLYTLSKSPLTAAPTLGKPSSGRVVLPTDFNGRYRLFANGQWSGTLDLTVGDQGVVGGRFRSDQTGTSYPVKGQIALEAPSRIRFSVEFPRARQDFEARLWTDGKGAMAGTVSMLGQDYGFFAVREGGKFAPDDVDVGPVERGGSGLEALILNLDREGRITHDGKGLDADALADFIKARLRVEPAKRAVVRVAAGTTSAAIGNTVASIRSAGVRTIQITEVENAKEPVP
jgi:hypothetical protein